jgi:hypothetical protein
MRAVAEGAGVDWLLRRMALLCAGRFGAGVVAHTRGVLPSVIEEGSL